MEDEPSSLVEGAESPHWPMGLRVDKEDVGALVEAPNAKPSSQGLPDPQREQPQAAVRRGCLRRGREAGIFLLHSTRKSLGNGEKR